MQSKKRLYVSLCVYDKKDGAAGERVNFYEFFLLSVIFFSITFHSPHFHFIALQENNDQCLKIIKHQASTG